MINCSNKSNDEANKYFLYKDKYYAICCNKCIKVIIKTIEKNINVLNYTYEEVKHLDKVEEKILKEKINQTLIPVKKKKNKKSLKKKFT